MTCIARLSGTPCSKPALALLLTVLQAPAVAGVRENLARTPPASAVARAGHLERATLLDRLARSYRAERTGEVVFVPVPGVFFTTRPYPRDHGSPWDYDARVPLVLYGPEQVRPGRFADPRAQPRDLAATLAAAVGIPPPPGSTGRAWREVLVPGRPPRAVLLLVMDQVGSADLERLEGELPHLARMRRQGAEFTEVRIDYLPTFTGVSHASIGTGAPPALHGITGNYVATRDHDALRAVFGDPGHPGVDPSWNLLPTLADWWDERFENRAHMITQIDADYAATAIGGHGAARPGADRDVVVWYDAHTGRPTTDPRWFRIPDYIQRRSVDGIVSRHGSSLPTAGSPSPRAPGQEPRRDVRATPWYARWEADAVIEMMIREQVGRDEVPDLVQVNLKVTDTFGHHHGHENPGFVACMREIDRFLGAAETTLRRRAGEGRYLIAVTADHGLAPDDAVARYYEDLVLWLGSTLDARGDRDGHSAVVGTDGYQVFLDPVELAEEGADASTVRDLLRQDPHVLEAWTALEIRRRAEALGLIR